MTAPIPFQSRVYIHTLGCPKNDADSRGLSRVLMAAGVEVVADPAQSTHVLINTCGFIQDAKEEAIGAILEACATYGGERVLVMGCLVERYRAQLEAGIPEVAGWFGLVEDLRLAELLHGLGHPADETGCPPVDKTGSQSACGSVLTTAGPSADPGLYSHLSYAYVKISDGCDEPCTFCAIPIIKGPYHSMDTAAIVAEVDACLREGAQEIILVGQDTAVWKRNDRDLIGLVDLLAADARVRRLRLMYLQPEHVSDALLQYMAEQPKLCRYLDLPFQHADGEVLRRMGRWGDGDIYRELVARARRLMPDVSLRSTFIVGFPGETEEQFAVLMDFIDHIGFDNAGGFIYSPEEGTQGAQLRPRVKRRVALDRLNRLTALIAARAESEHRRLVDSTLEVIVDTIEPDDEHEVTAVGRTEGQAPDIDGVTYIEGDLPQAVGPGDMVRVVITDAVGHDLIGRYDAP